MELSSVISIAERIKQARAENLNEAMTKTSLVMPFLQELGYDVFNHNEVAAEYTSDFGTKKGEKVDFAILQNGIPVMLIECKPLGATLDAGKCSQLFRYFSTHPETRIAILTDGCRYLFFSDIDSKNVMDNKPFMDIDLSSFNERFLSQLKKLTKEHLDVSSVLSSASVYKYISETKKLISENVVCPSEDIVRYFASRVYSGRVTAKIHEQFNDIVKKAFEEYVDDAVDSRLESAKFSNKQAPQDVTIPLQSSNEEDAGIVTTDDELCAFFIIQAILRETINPRRVVMRDAKSYCAILLDDNNRKPLCRMFLDAKKPSIILFDGDNEERVYIEALEDIYLHADRLKSTAKKHDQK